MIGLRLQELLTPCLVLDMDKAQANLASAVDYLAKRGKTLRPHFKAHRCPAISLWQLSAGARGCTCARLDEVEALLDAGVTDILLANTIAGGPKCRTAAQLAARGPVMFALDNTATAELLDAQAAAAGANCRYIIDIDLGMDRSGVAGPAAAMELYRALAGMKNLSFAGLMGYEGHLATKPAGQEKRKQIRQALAPLAVAAGLFRKAGIDVPIVSCGGTGSYLAAAEEPAVTELQMGSFMFMDDIFRRAGVELQPAAYILARVTYRNGRRVVLDCGMKGVHPNGGVTARDDANLVVEKLNAEHAICALRGDGNYAVGDLVPLNVSYADGTFNLYSQIIGVRNGRVEKVFPKLAGQ